MVLNPKAEVWEVKEGTGKPDFHKEGQKKKLRMEKGELILENSRDIPHPIWSFHELQAEMSCAHVYFITDQCNALWNK